MNFEPKRLDDGSLQVTVTISPDEVKQLGSQDTAARDFRFGKTDYCVTCRDDQGREYKYTIETYGDLAANFEAAVTCTKEVGNPSYKLSKGSCS